MQMIFLSYAHADNLAPRGGDRQGWVNFFDESLTIELGERGLAAKLWRDKRDFDPMGVVSETLRAAVEDAVVFLAVLSPRYIEQAYCRFELETFVRKKAAGGNIAKNILLVLKRPLPDERYPEPLRGMGYLPFFEIDRQSNEDRPFFDGFGAHVAQRYWEAVRKVASLIERSLAEASASRPEPEAAKRPATATVYLADTASDLSDMNWSIRKELEAQGCRIVPSDPWPPEADAARRHLRDAVEEAAFSVHLLGATAGSDSASGLAALSKLQLDLAAERAAKDPGFRRLIWLPDGLKPTEASQQELIRGLEDGTCLLAQDELVRSGLESFKEVIRDELTRHIAAKAKPVRLYLVCEASDEAEALALRPALVEAGFEVDLPEFGPDGTVPVAERERCLADCEAVLLFWGKGAEGQVRKALDEIEGAVARLRQGKPFSVRGLYLAPPSTPRKKTFASHMIDQVVQEPGDLGALKRNGPR